MCSRADGVVVVSCRPRSRHLDSDGLGHGVTTEGLGLEGAACAPDAWNGNMLAVRRVVELFYADPVDDPEATEMALEICGRCVVRSECAELYLDERYGIWGGMTEGERALLRRKNRNESM